MSYDLDFYALYADYLREPRVRAVHDRVLSLLVPAHPALRRVVDMGCGRGNEYLHHARPDAYIGIDVNALPGTGPVLLAEDYRDPARVNDIAKAHGIGGAVSLFSVECTAPWQANLAFYEGLFSGGGIDVVLTAGFYYEHAASAETVGEAGGIVSYQSIQPLEMVRSDVFDEARLALPCPSSLFGEDVVEVWKVLTRTGRAAA